MAGDPLSLNELDMVWRYMSNTMHLGVPSKGLPAKSRSEDPALLTGRFTRNTFVLSVLEH